MKKMHSLLCLLLAVVLIFGAVGALAVHADEPISEDEPAEVTYTKEEVTAYVFAADATKTFECFFRSDLPEVPYVDPHDYLGTIYTDEFTVTDNGSGVFTVTNVNGLTMEIDAENDTVHFGNYDDFIDCAINDEGSSIDIDYVQNADGYYTVDPGEITIDLASYGIDVYAADGKVYLPLTVIAAMFSYTYNNALFLDGEICFIHTFDPESYYDDVDDSSRYEELTRSREMADFTYNTLCLFFDYFYGYPTSAILSESLVEHGLDETLETYDDYTRFAKELLLSENRSEYFSGLAIVGFYLYDGGHTVLPNIPIIAVNYYSDMPLGYQWYSDINEYTDVADAVWACLDILFDLYDESGIISGVREGEYEKYQDEIVKTWESEAYLIIHGDTAVFVFDSFEEDTPDEIKEALDLAKEAGVVNFVLDDSCNGGGYVAACEYICTLISNSEKNSNTIKISNMDPLTGAIYEVVYEIDLNLDGEFNDEDKAVGYDFHYAILTSHAAFSCGNMLPVLGHDLGILTIGETSGGGSCVVTERYLADGFAFPISDINKSVLPDGTDFDLGAPIDYDLTLEDEEGNTDYSRFYDIDLLSKLINLHYNEDAVHDEHIPSRVTYENVVEATCTEDGSCEAVVYCLFCGEELSRDELVLDAGHIPSDEPTYENIDMGSCTVDGSYDEVYYCVACGEELSRETQTIPASGHVPAEEAVTENVKDATCEGKGSYDLVVYCSTCGEELSRETVETKPLGHEWGDWFVDTPSSETQKGVEIRICAHDETHIERRDIPELGHVHKLEKVEKKDPTETEDGNTEYYVCSGCDRWFEDAEGTTEITDKNSVIIPATGHYEPPQAGSGVEVLIVLSVLAAFGAAVIVVRKRTF